jgi:hypothetical protein
MKLFCTQHMILHIIYGFIIRSFENVKFQIMDSVQSILVGIQKSPINFILYYSVSQTVVRVPLGGTRNFLNGTSLANMYVSL